MGIYFRKRKNIAPGVSLNVSNKSAGVSLGVKGLHVSTNTNGTKTMSASIPGTGLSARKTFGKKKPNPIFNDTQNNFRSDNTGNNGNNNKKPWYKRTWVIVSFSIIALLLLVSAFGDDDNSNNENSESIQKADSSTTIEDTATTAENVPISTEIDTTLPAATPEPTTTVLQAEAPAIIDDTTPITENVPISTEIDTTLPSATPEPTTTVLQTEAFTTAPEPQQNLVWISETGKKYHSDPSCSNMKNPRQVTLEEALSLGLEPCKRCH